MSLNNKRKVFVAVILAGSVLLLLGGCLRSVPLIPAGAAVCVVGVAMELKWWRCPHCGRFLGRDVGPFCAGYGERIDYDAK